MASLYTVVTSLRPGVEIEVGQAEFERLTDLDLIDSLVSVRVKADEVQVGTEFPASPQPGTVFVNNSFAPTP